MIEIGITKKQHYVSQGILKHFADQQKKIYELFIDKSIVTKKSIVDTMSQNYVYEHSKIEKNSIEDLFAKFESTRQMEWVRRCNNIHNRVEEIVLHEMIYS